MGFSIPVGTWFRGPLRGWIADLLLSPEARGRGCTTAMVDTFDFQAPRFYEAEGYTIWGVLEGYPPGHQRFYLRKTLGDHTD